MKTIENFKGTKGKWELEDTEIFSEEGNLLGGVYGEYHDNMYYYTETTYANALLMSKAPEMLEMLEEAMSLLGNLGELEIAREIQQLIKDATEL